MRCTHTLTLHPDSFFWAESVGVNLTRSLPPSPFCPGLQLCSHSRRKSQWVAPDRSTSGADEPSTSTSGDADAAAGGADGANVLGSFGDWRADLKDAETGYGRAGQEPTTPKATADGAGSASAKAASTPLPSDWQAVVDTSTNTTYYHSKSRRKSQWVKPEPADAENEQGGGGGGGGGAAASSPSGDTDMAASIAADFAAGGLNTPTRAAMSVVTRTTPGSRGSTGGGSNPGTPRAADPGTPKTPRGGKNDWQTVADPSTGKEYFYR